MIPARFNGNSIDVMLDTGAQPSVVAKRTLKGMNLSYSIRQDQLYGVGKSPIPICGTLELEIDVGDGQKINHFLNTDIKTAILERNLFSKLRWSLF